MHRQAGGPGEHLLHPGPPPEVDVITRLLLQDLGLGSPGWIGGGFAHEGTPGIRLRLYPTGDAGWRLKLSGRIIWCALNSWRSFAGAGGAATRSRGMELHPRKRSWS